MQTLWGLVNHAVRTKLQSEEQEEWTTVLGCIRGRAKNSSTIVFSGQEASGALCPGGHCWTN